MIYTYSIEVPVFPKTLQQPSSTFPIQPPQTVMNPILPGNPFFLPGPVPLQQHYPLQLSVTNGPFNQPFIPGQQLLITKQPMILSNQPYVPIQQNHVPGASYSTKPSTSAFTTNRDFTQKKESDKTSITEEFKKMIAKAANNY